MKKNLLLIFILLSTLCLYADDKRYKIKSGIIHYDTISKGITFGVTTESKGTKTVYFKDWGTLELRDETETENIMDQKKTTRNIVKLDKNISYSVDFNKKMIIKMDISQFNQNVQLNSEKALKALNAKKMGIGNVLGYNCEIWNLLGSKAWIYKGIPLKIESNVMGITTTETATSAKFNVSISSDKFKLPDFPIKSLNQIITDEMSGVNTDDPSNGSENYQMSPNIPSQKEMMNLLQNFSKNLNNN